MEKPHNGYSNFETWTVASVIDNTESMYNRFRHVVRMLRNNYQDETERVNRLADEIKAFIGNMMPNKYNFIWSPIMNDILENKINFREIATLMFDNYE